MHQVAARLYLTVKKDSQIPWLSSYMQATKFEPHPMCDSKVIVQCISLQESFPSPILCNSTSSINDTYRRQSLTQFPFVLLRSLEIEFVLGNVGRICSYDSPG